MHYSKHVKLDQATAGISNVRARIYDREGSNPKPPREEPYQSVDPLTEHLTNVPYGDEHHPYIDTFAVYYQLQNSDIGCEFTVGACGDKFDIALNTHDTFFVSLKGNIVDVVCFNSDRSGSTEMLAGIAT